MSEMPTTVAEMKAVFGQVESQRREKVDAALELRNAELRSRMLIAIRKLQRSDFDEPKTPSCFKVPVRFEHRKASAVLATVLKTRE